MWGKVSPQKYMDNPITLLIGSGQSSALKAPTKPPEGFDKELQAAKQKSSEPDTTQDSKQAGKGDNGDKQTATSNNLDQSPKTTDQPDPTATATALQQAIAGFPHADGLPPNLQSVKDAAHKVVQSTDVKAVVNDLGDKLNATSVQVTAASSQPNQPTPIQANGDLSKIHNKVIGDKIKAEVGVNQKIASAGSTDEKTDNSSAFSDGGKSDNPKFEFAAVIDNATSKPVDANQPTMEIGATQALSSDKREALVRQVTDRIQLLAASRPKEGVTIELQPPSLGTITVNLKDVSHSLQAQLTASSGQVKEALDSSKEDLNSRLKAHGISVGQIQVTSTSQTATDGRLGGQSHSGNPGGQSGSHDEYRDGTAGFQRRHDSGTTSVSSHSSGPAHVAIATSSGRLDFTS